MTPTPLFWEGFNIAGDDIVKRLIEFILIPQIADALRNQGGKNIQGTMAYMFGPDLGAQSATHRIKRRQFVNQIGNAFAHFVLALAHSDDFEAQHVKLGDVFDQEAKPENDLIPYLNKEIEGRLACQMIPLIYWILTYILCRIKLSTVFMISWILWSIACQVNRSI